MSLPIRHRELLVRKLWGVFRVWYSVENRRPDTGDKFKHTIRVRFLWWEYRWSLSTAHPYDDCPYEYTWGEPR